MSKGRHRRGHNLLEVTIAAFVFSTAAIIMIGVWGLYHRAINQNKNRLMASAFCKATLESQVARTYGNLGNDFVSYRTTHGLPAAQSFPVSFDSWVRGREVKTDFTANVTIYDCSLSASEGGPPANSTERADLQRIAHLICVVYWNEQGGDVDATTGQSVKSLTYDCYLFGQR